MKNETGNMFSRYFLRSNGRWSCLRWSQIIWCCSRNCLLNQLCCSCCRVSHWYLKKILNQEPINYGPQLVCPKKASFRLKALIEWAQVGGLILNGLHWCWWRTLMTKWLNSRHQHLIIITNFDINVNIGTLKAFQHHCFFNTSEIFFKIKYWR